MVFEICQLSYDWEKIERGVIKELKMNENAFCCSLFDLALEI